MYQRQRLQPHLVICKFLRMPFGLKNAAQTFQMFIDQVLRGLHFSYAYIDDAHIVSSSVEEHAQHL